MISTKYLRLMIFYSLAFAKIIMLINATKSVVFILVDDLRPAIAKGYKDQYAKTPNIDSLLQKSYYFTRAYAQQALCAPSRNSILTSRRPDTIRLYDFYNYWRNFVGNFTTLPQYFKNHNYTTHSVGKVFHPGKSSNYNDDYPLSWTKVPFHPKSDQYINSPVCPSDDGSLKANLICPVNVLSQPGKTLPDIEIMLEARRFLLEERSNFFLAVGFHKPHIPFRVPRKYFEEFPGEMFQNSTNDGGKPFGMPNVAWNPYTDIRKRDDFKYLGIPFPFGPIPFEKAIDIRRGYYSSVAYIDFLVGELLKNVNLDNTIVILTSDHGWSLGEHAEWAKYSNFEVAVRVPLIVYTPDFKLKKGKEVRHIVELIDLFPSIIDLAKLPKIKKCRKDINEETCVQGTSFYKLLLNIKRNFTKSAFSQYPRPGNYPTLRPNSDKPKLSNIKIMGYSVRTINFRYTAWIDFYSNNFTKNWDMIYGEELYDHRIDSSEMINLAGRDEFKDVQENLKQKLIKKLNNYF